jgi:hypothetical protein
MATVAAWRTRGDLRPPNSVDLDSCRIARRREGGRHRCPVTYTNRTSIHPNFGMVRIHQRTFVPSPPAGTELLELRFTQPDTIPGQAPPLLVSTVDLR